MKVRIPCSVPYNSEIREFSKENEEFFENIRLAQYFCRIFRRDSKRVLEEIESKAFSHYNSYQVLDLEVNHYSVKVWIEAGKSLFGMSWPIYPRKHSLDQEIVLLP